VQRRAWCSCMRDAKIQGMAIAAAPVGVCGRYLALASSRCADNEVISRLGTAGAWPLVTLGLSLGTVALKLTTVSVAGSIPCSPMVSDASTSTVASLPSTCLLTQCLCRCESERVCVCAGE
jgi:hypothetical protein